MSEPTPRSGFWSWGVCGLLLLATMVNYMDRLTLNQSAKRIKDEFGITNQQHYARIETLFGVAFAVGAVFSGVIVDRGAVRWYYPLMVFLWSLAGFLTGLARTYEQLLACRFFLGFFEAANWPCALYTTARILEPSKRTLGNGILQSGAALGAIFTPLIVMPFLESAGQEWRYPFLIVGAVGAAWVVLWLALIRPGAIPPPDPAARQAGPSMLTVWSDRRFWVLGFVVVGINATWHFFRVWMPLLLIEKHQYSQSFTAGFTSVYYISTDVGSIAAGFVTLALVRRGWPVHRSRMTVFLLFAVLTLLTIAAALLPRGYFLLATLLVVGFGALGVFPNYYAFTQELSAHHQGKVTGSLSFICWIAVAALKEGEGWLIQNSGFTVAVAVAGLPPLLSFLMLLAFWQRSPRPDPAPATGVPAAVPAPSA